MSQSYAPNRIREWRKKRGLTLEQVAARVSEDTAISTISKLEKGAMGFTLDWMHILSKILDVTPFDLIETGVRDVGTRTVPIRGAITAGTWREAIEDDLGSIPIPADLAGHGAYALRVEGDSMDQLVPDGGLVVLDPTDRDLRDGKCYAVQNMDGETTFKRFVADGPSLSPMSSNGTHQAIPLGREPFTVIARVVWAARAI